MATVTTAASGTGGASTTPIPPLESGDCLTRDEFERRYSAMPRLNKAELIEGAVRSGDRALIVDDVLTSGGSLLKAIVAARQAGLVVSQALVIVDRKERDGRARVEQEGVSLISLLTIDDLTRQRGRTP